MLKSSHQFRSHHHHHLPVVVVVVIILSADKVQLHAWNATYQMITLQKICTQYTHSQAMLSETQRKSRAKNLALSVKSVE